jgi:hypothetical protein
MGRPAVGKMLTGLVQAEQAVDREADFSGVFVLLAVVFPPANRAQRERACRFQRLVSATGTTKTSLQSFHTWMDEVPQLRVYAEDGIRPRMATPSLPPPCANSHLSAYSVSSPSLTKNDRLQGTVQQWWRNGRPAKSEIELRPFWDVPLSTPACRLNFSSIAQSIRLPWSDQGPWRAPPGISTGRCKRSGRRIAAEESS